MKNKFFTIIIPLYNPKRIKRCFDSIKNQNLNDDIEVILVDDNSSDKSYISLLKDYDFEYKIIENNETKYPGVSRQIGLDNATGEWVTFLDHDDDFADNCFNKVKERIIATKCSFMFVTNMIIAQDDQWMFTKQYAVDDQYNLLHGKFYNRKQLKKYGVRFHTKLVAEEDTYFGGVIEGVINFDSTLDHETARIKEDIITYIWYLWNDSTSHTEINGRLYMEHYFKEYIQANWESLLFVYNVYKSGDLAYFKSLSLFLHCYCFWEYFSYNYSDHDHEDTWLSIKKFKKDMCDLLGYTTDDELFSMINKHPDIFCDTFKRVNKKGSYIPNQTIKQFIENLGW